MKRSKVTLLACCTFRVCLRYVLLKGSVYFDGIEHGITVGRRNLGCLPFSQKIRKFRFKVKWKGKFPENPFGICGLPPEVVQFFRSEGNVGNFLTICFNFPFPGSSRGFSRSSIWQFNGKRNF